MTSWELQAWCPECEQAVVFACSREQRTTPAGHRILDALDITCVAGHHFRGHDAERVLHGDTVRDTA